MLTTKVLIYDNDPLHRGLLVDLMKKAGWDADAVDGRKEAEKAMDWWRPDVLVIDVDTRGASGSFLRKVRKRRPDLKVILIGGRGGATMRTLATEIGADLGFSTLGGFAGVVSQVRALYDEPAREGEAAIKW
jgi:DNA-binding response OmpR family regulator